jgi:DNA-binding transcriptional LysR family regulator
VDLNDFDLNLLVIFQQLMSERRVARVAANLGITQPAVSNALARMRRHLDDPLFVRTPTGMAPTPLAEQLAQPVHDALALLHTALNPSTVFEPSQAQQAMTIGMTDIGEIVFLPTLVEHLSRVAPGLRLSTVRNTAVNLGEDMSVGKVDLAIGLLPQLKAGFFQRRLFTQRYVCLFRRGHALDKKKLSLADFRAAEHLVVMSAGTGHGDVDKRMHKAGIERVVRLTVPHFVSVGHILQNSNLITTVPERLAQKLAEPFGLAHRPHPVALPEVAINVFWHAKVHQSGANQWLRTTVFELFGGKPA